MSDITQSVLIVDDENPIRLSLEAYFEDEGYSVVSAESGELALDILQEQSFDVGIIDMRLPGMNGVEFILKAAEINDKMRFLIYTGSTEFNLPQNLMDLGVTKQDLFRKPLRDMKVLVDAVIRLTNS